MNEPCRLRRGERYEACDDEDEVWKLVKGYPTIEKGFCPEILPPAESALQTQEPKKKKAISRAVRAKERPF